MKTQAAPAILERDVVDGGPEDLFNGDNKNCWVVLHTKSRQEKALSEDLRLLGIRHFLPTLSETRVHGSRKVVVTVPVFSGYLFLLGSMEDAVKADRTKHVVRIIPVADQARLQRELRDLQRALASGLPVRRHRRLERGVQVEVESGAMRGVRGVVEDLRSKNRIILQVNMLGSAISVDVDANSVVPLLQRENE